jgi:hypothetical protein
MRYWPWVVSAVPRSSGEALSSSVCSLLAAVIQHTRILRRLEAPDFAYDAMRPIAATVAIMLLLIGAFGLVGILL